MINNNMLKYELILSFQFLEQNVWFNICYRNLGILMFLIRHNVFILSRVLRIRILSIRKSHKNSRENVHLVSISNFLFCVEEKNNSFQGSCTK